MRDQGAADAGSSRADAAGGRPRTPLRRLADRVIDRVTDRAEALAFQHLPIPVLVRITRSRCARRRAALRGR